MHFFAANAAECAALRSRGGDEWVLEHASAFGTLQPPVASRDGWISCQQPLYRLYRPGQGFAHRLTTSWELRASLLRDGWIEEGAAYEPYDAPYAMCVIPDTSLAR
jgi:hypothetical protein